MRDLPETVVLLREFVRNPVRTGAVAPSGRRLADVLAGAVPAGGTVVELGPGTGAVTARIRRRRPARHVAVEINPRLARLVAARWPDVEVVCADAADLGAAVADGRADAVVSSLPWAVLPDERQRATMRAVRDALSDGGCFTTYAYVHALRVPAARRLAALLADTFADVSVSPVVWANVPPAVVYRARRPLGR
ncbi:class I SAM-dependent methyltransferase [Actinomadura sp. WAC 06369]|uniref:class I SAM-dependent methyltransferase n=1 Tax=Actinomadura sp. WAC 06369 TaxID=2203193 RepID=UPI000F772E3C|nr:methyltransferase domain-containing protein [Actinomadura sp. WAC 06369]RSN42528.1 SAM-dependent methyltransferase [Actinomadura sp. WAC 06369]